MQDDEGNEKVRLFVWVEKKSDSFSKKSEICIQNLLLNISVSRTYNFKWVLQCCCISRRPRTKLNERYGLIRKTVLELILRKLEMASQKI